MNIFNEINDEEFIPFLQKLGVDTYNKSFEWMLNDPDFAGVLHWLYNSLDKNNALTAREEYRYAEIEKRGSLKGDDELEKEVKVLQEEHKGICLPGDQEALEDIIMDIDMLKERSSYLQRQQLAMEDLIKQNELTKEELMVEVTKLNALQQQYLNDEATAAANCQSLAEEVETITEGVIDVISAALNIYGNCQNDKDLAKKFFTFGPYDAYRQTQALFRSHFDLYTSKKFIKKSDDISDEDLRAALQEAKSMEKRVSDAALQFVQSSAELSGELAKLNLVAHYGHVHKAQIQAYTIEAQTALELLDQEESILEQQVKDAIKDLVEQRSKLATETSARAALAFREQIHSDLSHLLEVSYQAFSLDRILYSALRQELSTLEELLHFTDHLKRYVIEESEATSSRIESMNEIVIEQESIENRLQNSDSFLEALCSILGISQKDGAVLVKTYNDLKREIEELNEGVRDGFKKKEEALSAFKKSTSPLHSYTADGCTRAPNSWNSAAAATSHRLRGGMAQAEARVREASNAFTQLKNGDKNELRKLWQWFLAEPGKLLAVVKSLPAPSYA